jgi:hypothetical protein
MGRIEGAFDGEQGGVGEGDDERLGRGIEVVGGGIGDAGPVLGAYDTQS